MRVGGKSGGVGKRSGKGFLIKRGRRRGEGGMQRKAKVFKAYISSFPKRTFCMFSKFLNIICEFSKKHIWRTEFVFFKKLFLLNIFVIGQCKVNYEES